MVKDLRTGGKTTAIADVMNGEIDYHPPFSPGESVGRKQHVLI